jgi:hypothetical protein
MDHCPAKRTTQCVNQFQTVFLSELILHNTDHTPSCCNLPREWGDTNHLSASANNDATWNGGQVIPNMKTAWQLSAVSVLMCAFSSCGPQPPDVQFVLQKIPVEIQRGKPLTIEIHSLSGNGVNCVGIRCSPEVWSLLTNAPKSLEVRLKSSNKPHTEIGGVDPGSGASGFLEYIPNTHYLFYVNGEHRAEASVEITFANAPEVATSAEIIVGKTPIDTKL